MLAADEARAAAEVARVRTELPTRDEAVFNCHLGELALALEPTSEADPIGILASLLAVASVHVGPSPHIRAGDDRHPLYTELTQAPDGEGYTGDIRWNFEKFLVAPDGKVVARFAPQVEPEAPELTGAIEGALTG